MTNNKEKPTKQKLLEVVSGNRKLQDVKFIQKKSFDLSGNRKLQDVKFIQQKSFDFLCTSNGKVGFERKKIQFT